VKDLRFAVIGAGSGGLAMAGHLALLGASVRLYNRTESRVSGIRGKGCVSLEGAIEGQGQLTMVSSCLNDVLRDSDLLMVVVPAFAHEEIARSAAPFLRPDQIVILTPGRTGGALVFRKALLDAGVHALPMIAETQTILHTCRTYDEEDVVHVFAVKRVVDLAALPAGDTETVLARVRPFFPQFRAAANVLVTSLGNVGAVLHPAPTLFNMGWIEAPHKTFLYYYEGITESVAQYIERIDNERVAVARALNTLVPTVTQWLGTTYGAAGETLLTAIRATEAYKEVVAPRSLGHRYIHEDIPTGLVPISSLGDLAGVPTPFADLTIDLASKVTGCDFRALGRTTETMGLESLDDRTAVELFGRAAPFPWKRGARASGD